MVEIDARAGQLKDIETELLAVGVFKDGSPPEELDQALSGTLSGLMSSGDFSGKEDETVLIYTREAISSPRLLLVGLGEEQKFGPEKVRRSAATAAKKSRSLKRKNASFVLPVPQNTNAESAAQAAAEGAALGLYRFDHYKTGSENERHELDNFTIIASDAEAANRGAGTGARIAAGEILARDLANEPGNTATPTFLGDKACEIAEKYGMEATILDKAGAEVEGLTGLLAVAQGSNQEPRFIVLEHRKGGDEAPVVLIGKAVTFDSGGISIKPSTNMEDMKYDMSGGAAVLGAMEAVGSLELPVNVVAIVPSTENLPNGKAYKPGDVIKMHSGKTVEILSTDAEGRMILADALSYTRRFNPAAVIDCATLTGACVIALGHHAAGLMGNDEDLIQEVLAAGEATGERAWHLPLFDEYSEQIKGETADIKNTGGRYGGALTAGAFLKEFVDYPWVHLDIAGTAWDRPAIPYRPKGATGEPTRLLVQFLKERVR